MLARVTNWSKKALVVSMMALVAIGYVACSEEEALNGSLNFVTQEQISERQLADDSLGIIHNSVLKLAYENFESARGGNTTASANSTQSFQAIFDAGNLTLKKAGLDTLTEENAWKLVNLGSSLANSMFMLPEGTESINEVLFGSRPADDVSGRGAASGSATAMMPIYLTQYINILRVFVNEGRSNSAMEAYDSTVMILGAPEPASDLARFMSILKYSAKFWLDKDPITPGTLGGLNETLLQGQSWSDFMRKVAAAAVDAAGGVLTGLAIGAATGPGALATGIVGGVVSALGSYGAHELIGQ